MHLALFFILFYFIFLNLKSILKDPSLKGIKNFDSQRLTVYLYYLWCSSDSKIKQNSTEGVDRIISSILLLI